MNENYDPYGEVFSDDELEDISLWEDEFSDEDSSEDPEFAGLPDLSEFLPPAPPQQEQDIVLEGLGAPGDAPRTPRQACRHCASYIREDKWIESGYCLRYTRGWFLVGSLYVSAKEAYFGIDEDYTHRIRDWKKVPRGVIVYWPEKQYGHVAISLGSGFVGSTDWPTNQVGKVQGEVLTRSWGYTKAYWSPYINGVRVWNAAAPKPKPKPKPERKSRGERVDHAIRDLAGARKAALQNGNERRARIINSSLKELLELNAH